LSADTAAGSANATYATIVVPTLNEGRYLERCVRSVLDDPHPRDRLELLIVDGGSSDETVVIGERLAAELPFVRLLQNPRRLQAAAFNLALRHADARATCIVRCDAHALYPNGFLSRAIDTLRHTEAAMVGFHAAAVAESPFQEAVAFAQSIPAGVGASEYRLGKHSGWVDSAMHGCFSRSAVEAVGGYDESASHNEDAELSLRLRKAGGGIWLDDGLRVAYFPRSSPGALARQYFLYGLGRASTVVAHAQRPLFRQLAPPLLVLAHSACVLAALRGRRIRPLAPVAAYLMALATIGVTGAIRRSRRSVLAAPLAIATMHHAWGAGFLVGLARAASRRRRNRATGRSDATIRSWD
jgi:succinoglycan biosynthesis protein ExoA